MEYGVGLAASVFAALGVVAACGNGDDSGNQPPVSGTDSPTLSGSFTSSGTDSTASGTDTETSDTMGTTGSDVPTNCNDLQCSGPGSCMTADNGMVFCACDDGYKLDDDDPTTCVVDETCIQVRFLEDHCRQLIGAAPAVALFFGLDFCAGTAVTPEKFAELGIQFVVLENDTDIARNPESSVTVVETNVENYVNLVIDVSDSLTGNEEFLPGLVDALGALLDTLEPAAGDPDVYVAVHVFARQNAEYVAFTRDLGSVRSALQVLVTDPGSVIDIAGGGMGTDLFDATKEAIENTQRIRDLRDAVTWGGVLSTGTVVVITDGKDASNGMLDQGLIDGTTNQVISVGLGLDIDDEQLRNIGRDGNFLAPEGDDLAEAFAEINTRVDQYPLRSYMLAYCSSTTEGDPTVAVSMQGGALTEVTAAECKFNAELFSSQAFECNAMTFANECNSQSCGGITGCGACADDECCTGAIAGACVGPSIAPPTVPCVGQPEVCAGPATENICVGEPPGVCVEAAELGEDHGETACTPGCPRGYGCETTVDEKMVTHSFCEPLAPLGTPCSVPSECASYNCFFVDEDNPFEGRRCLPEARIYDHCGDEDAVCEDGASCEGNTCERRQLDLTSCSRSDQCRHARCVGFEEQGNYCDPAPQLCYWSWDEKAPT